jgi:D-alanyl-D-alanine carboxypeptidase
VSAGEARAALAGYVDGLTAHGLLPGLSLAVVDAGGVTFSLCHGVRDLATADPVTPATRFEIGSISKSFTSIVVLGLASRGALDLDAPVATYLPWFAVRSRFAPITVRHLLQHTAGLITGADAMPDDRAQVWELRHTEAGAEPGSWFHYSNAGYLLLGLVVEAVTGRSAAQMVAESILEPLGMTGSTAQVLHEHHDLLATGYGPLHDDRPWLPGDPLIPATWFEVAAADGNVAATAHDLGRYLSMLLGRGRFGDVEVLDGAGFAELTRSLAPGGEPSDHPSRYGLGVNMETIGEHSCLTHGGGMVGYAAFVVADLDAGFGIAVLTNAPGDSSVAELVARTGYELWRAELDGATPAVPAAPEPWVVEDAQRYVGTYAGAGLQFTVTASPGGGLTLSDRAGSGRLGWSGDRLACTHPGWRTFHHDLDGVGDERVWTWGGAELRPLGTTAPAPVQMGDGWLALPGHYRSYSPWYTNFRIVLRGGGLHLVAAGGVEGSRDDPLLVELSPGRFRIGAEAELPERLVVGPVVDGRAIYVVRDGCTYSRTFTD